MATSVTLNGVTFSIPETEDEDWSGATGVDGYLVALATGVLQKAGGNFTLTADVDFGATYGLKSAYFTSRTSNAASAGAVRLARADVVSWRNQANGANLDLSVNSSNQLLFNGALLVNLALGAANTVLKVNSGGTASEYGLLADANIDSAAAIAHTKLANITAGRVLLGNSSNVPTATAISGDITISDAGVVAIASGVIVNDDIHASAAIDWSKISKVGSNLTDLATRSHTALSDIGTNTHSDIDNHIANTSNPHSVDATDVGLGNVDNTSDSTKNSATATLTNKTVGDALTFTEVATPSTPSTGLVKLYPKSDGNFYKIDDTGVEVAVGSGAGGSGEKNYIENPSGESSTTGWANVGDLDIARTTTAADLPREYTTGSGLKITADSNTQSTSDYVYYDFTLDDVDLSKKLKIQWAQKVTGTYTAGQLAVGITTQADRTTFLHTPVTTAIPASDGVFVTSFDASTTATLSLVIRATTDMTTDGGIVISDVIVGPGVITQGAVVGDWTSYTPTVTGQGTITLGYAEYRRVGTSMDIRGAWAAGTVDGTTLSVTLPTGFAHTAVNNSIHPGSMVTSYGSATQGGIFPLLAIGNTGVVYWTHNNSRSGFIGLAGNSITTNSASVAFSVTGIPISQWAGSGTVNLAQNTPEYAYNSSTSTSANDTSSFAYGPAGALIQNISATLYRDVTLQYPMQVGDILDVQVSSDRTTWLSAGARVVSSSGYTIPQFGYTYNGASYRGIGILPQSSTLMRVYFGEFQTTYSSTNISWTTGGGGALYWRVLHAPAGSAVGYGAADGTNSGLLPPVTSMGDALATQLGHKQYLHGGSYSGGGAPTVTYSSGGGSLSSVQRALFIPYQTQSGQWRMRFNIVATFSSTSRTDITISVNGVTFKNTTNDYQAISAAVIGVAGAYISAAYVSPNASTMVIGHATVSSSQYAFSGDVELESKPTWAY